MDKIVYGLDLPIETTKENAKIYRDKFNLTEEEINAIDISDDKENEDTK